MLCNFSFVSMLTVLLAVSSIFPSLLTKFIAKEWFNSTSLLCWFACSNLWNPSPFLQIRTKGENVKKKSRSRIQHSFLPFQSRRRHAWPMIMIVLVQPSSLLYTMHWQTTLKPLFKANKVDMCNMQKNKTGSQDFSSFWYQVTKGRRKPLGGFSKSWLGQISENSLNCPRIFKVFYWSTTSYYCHLTWYITSTS